MIALIDYGVGNLFSLTSSLAKIGADCVVTDDKKIIESADGVILPGVGAFGDAAKKLEDSRLKEVVLSYARGGRPLLGICLGMQLLFDRSFEYGEHRGLGLIAGEVRPLEQFVKGQKIPHMGWNALKLSSAACPLFKYTSEGEYVYFVHSFCGVCDENADLAAVSDYGGYDITAAVRRGNVMGTQFHPEKSGEVGLKMLKAFCEMCEGVQA